MSNEYTSRKQSISLKWIKADSGQTYVQRRVAAGRDAGQDVIERIDVNLGVRYEGVVEVLDGLSEGDEVVWVPASTPFDFGER